MEIPTFETRKELFDFLVKNEETLIAQKKAQIKYADAIPFIYIDDKGEVIKVNNPVTDDIDQLKVRAVINTTNLMDSHLDVHLPGLWTKSLKENKSMMHLQEHRMAFDAIIADGKDLKAYTKSYTWSELGFKFDGDTQALIFDSMVKESRNEFMFNQYKSAHVKNHSVGMHYVKIVMAINDESYGAQFEAWEKYYPKIANKDFADAIGYFWAVKEAKAIEGSAVPRGSNYATPTLDNNLKEPVEATQPEPPEGTQIDFKKELETIKFF